MSTIQRAAKEAGVDQVICPHCGSKFGTIEVIKLFFKGALELLRRGERINIPEFGIFKARMIKGRSHKTPITPDGTVTFPDTWVVHFKQSKKTREYLNAIRKDNNDDS